jgi:kynurenine formamidase
MATDWVALRIEYINGSMQYKELAAKHKLKEGTVRQRANREGWAEERNALSRAVTQAANASLGDERATRLAKFNDQDAKIAEALKAKAAKLLGRDTIDASELSALSRVFDTAQKMGLLALGAATANTTVSTRTLEPLKDQDFLG